MNKCPFKQGDVVTYKPSRRGYGLEDGERLVIGKNYRVERIDDGVYVVVEGYRHPGGGLYWTEFEKFEEKRGDWIKVYDLAEDKKLIAEVQNATLNTKDYGLVPEIALFGSKEWWNTIEKGIIPTYEINGIISRVYMSGHNNWPEFEIDSDGKKTSWARMGIDELYRAGCKVKLEYVVQKAKKSWTGSPYQNEVIRIYISNK